MTGSGTWSSPPGPETAARPTALLSRCPAGAFRLLEEVRLRVASAAAAQCPSEYRSACRWPAVAAGSSAIRGQADGAGSFQAIGAAAAGRRRGGSFYAGRPGGRRDDEMEPNLNQQTR